MLQSKGEWKAQETFKESTHRASCKGKRKEREFKPDSVQASSNS